jgi:uncharacterized protein YjbI with pentapeptide repeats
MPSKKQRAAEAPQPPSFTMPLPSAPASVEQLVDRASYAGQRWHDLHLDAQEADDCSFEQLHIRGGSLRETHLTLAQFADCKIETVDLAGAVWEKAYLRRVEFVGCRLTGMQWLDADLEDVRFTNCAGQHLRIWTSMAQRVRLEQCTLGESSFVGSKLPGAVFVGCDLAGADLRDTMLKGADLRGSALGGLKIGPRELNGVIVSPAQAVDLIELFGVVVRVE